MMNMPLPVEMPILHFGGAELDTAAQELRIDGKRAPVGRRGLGVLRALIDCRQRAVSKRELLDSVWQGLVVEENNLQVQISSLRRLLGPQSIATIPGRGYRFMLPLDDPVPPQSTPPDRADAPSEEIGNLPSRLPELYGREVDSAALRALIDTHALVTIVGAAGIGKTRLATSVARLLQVDADEGRWLVELAALNDPRLLVQTIAQAMHLALPGLREPVEELSAALRGRRTLLLVDNCEHLVDEVGALLARLLREVGKLRVLATSQEPLRAPDEQVFRLAPLSVPPDADVDEPTAYGAVRLFVERVRATRPQFAFGTVNVGAVVEICRRLDGLPLAIELAAARVPLLGVEGVRERLGERFRMLTGGSRVAPKRHQTLRAALNWSHALLSDDEKAVYRRLSVFVGSFSLEGAQELAASDQIDSWTALEILAGLVEKSLVLAEGEPRPRYRMLESTREHALEQLSLADETDVWIARHGEATQRVLERAIKLRDSESILAEMPNVRSAYEWARGAGGNPMVAVALATLPSMVIAIEGAVQEARQRLVEVEPLVSDALPRHLVAQYWQWYGRIGLDGRLPTSRCVEAFQRAERIFLELGSLRHVHACRRHLAEAMLDAGDLAGADEALEKARAMESEPWPDADRMRRLRVRGLWLAKSGRTDEALRISQRALDMAQLNAIDRYQLVVLDDIARMHLEADHAHEAAERYRALAKRAGSAQNAGLTLSNAFAGLIAALTAEDHLDDADRVTQEALPVLARSGILEARADILAWLMARRRRFELAARLLAASENFRAGCETPRDPVEQRCRDATLALLDDQPAEGEPAAIRLEAREDDLVRVIRAAIAS